jgi:TIR domain
MGHVVFFSYARRDADTTKAIASGLQQLGQTVWLDQQLSGGQQWWDTILEQIRNCDVFLFVLSKSSLRSKACRAELDYAHRLGRTLLPVSVDRVIDQLLPPYLAETQRVDGADLVQLARALLGLPSPPPLPEPLPPPPPVPLSYLDELADSLNREDLPLADQRNLLGALKQLVTEDDEREAAVELLRRLRRHPQVNAWVAEETDAELAKLDPAAATAARAATTPVGAPAPTLVDSAGEATSPPQASPSTRHRTVTGPASDDGAGSTPGPRPPRRRPAVSPPPPVKRRKARAVLLAALLGLVLAGAGVAASFGSGSDDSPDPPLTTDDSDAPTPTEPPPTEPPPTEPPTTEPPTTEPPTTEPAPDLGALRDACIAGDMVACDDLFTESELGSDDEAFGSFCGGISAVPLEGACKSTFG